MSTKNPNKRTRMWQAMRTLNRFGVPEIAATADVEPRLVGPYLSDLYATGYLRRVRASSGTTGGHAIYQMARNTGPKSPEVTHVKLVRDGNTGELRLPNTEKGDQVRELVRSTEGQQ